ncbi:exodeoxyribonuclease V subunit gamma [Thalassotalea sp. PP2-459]|uniref:exodeoxyribonuclease V subunit gamma n=1 Tax=Thalassotalea sp. PP2-459 TaxID=1742724 RepID=UPI000945A750|nr:exodeoxyribonuclease V subunit gamma [Thalassotalea sp. PP2-459]OKY24976.1 exodeoxyribonuclease V subunit gamma [Thalassotalea sp. PP2-459]
MIYLYPANKTENLLLLASKIQEVSPLPLFSQDVYIVQNAGMQHWLSMSLAQSSGISFNHQYALPAQFLWKLMRALVLPKHMIDQDPFTREALSWRIYQLLASSEIIEDSDFSSVTEYWFSNISQQDPLKRYQLSCQVADLYEQYLIYRPDWLTQWQNNVIPDEFNQTSTLAKDECWQRKLWAMLTRTQSYDPIALVNHAISQLPEKSDLLPKRISFFGINAMAPIWLSFLEQVSQYTQVHFYHLNPCFDYWGDIVSEKQAIQQLNKWTTNLDQMHESVGNPLLANLGQQGREFLSLIQQYSTVSIEAFDRDDAQNDLTLTVLQSIQHDILTLTDKRQQPVNQLDDSIVITSAHSALREVQGVHDWLLHQFNKDDTLTPKDVLVMCPQIEDYAPYVNAVFAQGWQDYENDVPPLPCSIADRVAKNSDPLVIAFTEMLSLPDSRFQVSQIVSWLRLAALQSRFKLQPADVDKMALWLEKSAIHWGLDAQHKSQVLNVENASAQFTWQNGFSRLLQGFAYGDNEVIFDEHLLLPDIEGQDAVLLGLLMELIERLQQFRQALNRSKTPEKWHLLLSEMLLEFFDESHDSIALISTAIDNLLTYTKQGSFDEDIELSIVREFLTEHFSQPDPGRHFMIGQVTFCSMLPMRSIPFKVICILGLNDGDFPRVRTPFGFDLLSQAKSRIGDRSRRGDDRYLFLEGLLSARQALYLSYQGRSIKNNKQKQPSIVLNELCEYLHLGYGWQCFADQNQHIRQLAMHPYSLANYENEYASFDANWFTLGQKVSIAQVTEQQDSMPFNIPEQPEKSLESIDVKQLLRFLAHPSKYFAEQQLGLFLAQQTVELSNSEPFVADHISKYLLKQHALIDLLQHATKDLTSAEQAVLSYWQQYAGLSGKFADSSTGKEDIAKLLNDSEALYHHINETLLGEVIEHELQVPVTIAHSSFNRTIDLTHHVMSKNNKLIVVRASTPKAKDYLHLYFSLALLQQAQQTAESSDAIMNIDASQCTGYFFDNKAQKIITLSLSHVDWQTITRLILHFIQGQNAAYLTNADLALAIENAKVFEQQQLDKLWQGDANNQGLHQDPYLQYFWQQCPELSSFTQSIFEVYGNLFSLYTKEKV